MSKYRFTVFTPCYNCADKIHRVVESLQSQTYRDFEWIVVDDGSTDGLATALEPTIAAAAFPLKLFRQEENKGKPSAINLGVAEAEGEFFLIIDADDAFVPEALATLNDAYQSLPDEMKAGISGVTANCRDQRGAFIGTPYPSDGNNALICDVFDMRYKYRVEGEKWGFTKTDIMREFPFNTDVDSFVTENTVWFAIADKYKAAFINKTLRVYYRFESDQCLSAIGQKRHPAGFVFYYREIINKYMGKMRLGLTGSLRVYKNYVKYTLYAKSGIARSIGDINAPWKKALTALAIPLGMLAIALDKRKRTVK